MVLTALAIPLHTYLARFDQVGQSDSQALYLLLLIACAVSTLFAAFTRSRALRLFYAISFALSVAFAYGYQAIMANFLTYDAFVTMVRARGFLGETLTQFASLLTVPVIAGLLVLAGVAIAPRKGVQSALTEGTVAALPLAAILGLTAMLYARGGDGATGLPSSIVTPAYSLLYGIEVLSADQGTREAVSLAYREDDLNYDVVLVIDESIRGDFLDVGNIHGVTSNLLGGNRAIHNFGLGASGTNCSEGSNLLLRFGGTRDNYNHTINTQPSIFHYAKHRGLKTVYIDGQRTGKRLHNGMDSDELSVIDEFVQLDAVEVVHRDIRIAEMIVERSRNGVSEFILVNKVGAHFPVHDKYPDEYMHFTPVLDRGKFVSISDTGERTADLTWDRYKNSYRNTLLWSVGKFFQVLLHEADLGRTFLIYTSDHGQNFGEKEWGFNLHCSPDPSMSEGLVPMTVITDVPAWSETAAAWAERNFERTSHYRIFPTLLKVMGYSDLRIRDKYGPSLFEEMADPMTFNYQFYARLGTKPLWRKVEISRDRKPNVSIAH
jgi:glucan phosphoethanolaminetransferase (alkaline phosphatase superfamily)